MLRWIALQLRSENAYRGLRRRSFGRHQRNCPRRRRPIRTLPEDGPTIRKRLEKERSLNSMDYQMNTSTNCLMNAPEQEWFSTNRERLDLVVERMLGGSVKSFFTDYWGKQPLF